MAITDHGTSLGGVSIYQLLSLPKDQKETKIKYIHGCEFYTCDDTSVKDKDNKYYHLIVLCKNEIGRINLNRLITISQRRENMYHKPRIDFEKLVKHKEGLIVLSACLAGELSRCIMSGEFEEAKRRALMYKNRFGDDYYIEIQSHEENKQKMVNESLVSLAKETNIPIVVTTDAHYVTEEDGEYQKKYAFGGNLSEDDETYKDCYIQSEEEVRNKLNYLPKDIIDEAIKNTGVVADKCNVEIPLSDPIMPKIEKPIDFSSNAEWLKSLCFEGFKSKLNIDYERKSVFDKERFFYRISNEKEATYEEYQLTQDEIQEYIKRFEWELSALVKMNFVDYILLVYSYANKGKRRGIARGSGGGSLVNYLTNITDVDPIEHGLLFERFIDVGALDLLEQGVITAKELKVPDIDLDFSNSSCKDVLKYLYDTYGESHVASIGKFGTNKTKGTIRDMCKSLGFTLAEEDEISKSFELYEIDDIDKMIDGKIPTIKGAEKAIAYVKKYPDLFKYVRKLIGLPKSFGLHACGKIIATGDLDNYLPSCYDKDGVRFLQGDMYDVEDVGLVKIDVLGLRTLDQEFDTLELSGDSKETLNPKQDYSDPKVLNIFNSGDTVGIFQMSSYGMKNTLKEMQVRGLEDLAIANALYRPGAMPHIDSFCRRRRGEEKVKYIHSDLEPILKSTYGIMIFQEQIIEIGRMAEMRNPDLLRKATAKKNIDLLNKIKPELQECLFKRGWAQEQFDHLWKDMLAFGKYSFNKSHAVAYAIISYMTAKQKAYHPKEFFAGLCNSFISKSDFAQKKAGEIFEDILRHDIRLARFNYKEDHRRCWVNKNREIVYAIPLIKGCNVQIAEAVYEASKIKQNYFWKLVNQINKINTEMYGSKANRSQLKTLIRLGFFDEYGSSLHLETIIDLLDLFSYGTSRSVSQTKIDKSSEIYSVIEKFSTTKTTVSKSGKINYRFVFDNFEEMMCALEEKILTISDFKQNIKTRLTTQEDLLGFAPLPSYIEEERPILYVHSVFPLKRKKDGKQFGYSIHTCSLGSGKTAWLTVFNQTYSACPLEKGDVIRCIKYDRNNRGYFTLQNYEKIYT